MKRSAEARKVLRELDAELAQSAIRLGEPSLEWSAAERVILDQIADGIDRKVDLLEAYSTAVDDPKARVKLSSELRLLEQSIARLLRHINTEPPAPKSVKHVRAAQARWNRGAGA